MSATTPALRGGIGNERLGAALPAVALAIVALIAMAALMMAANRTTTGAPLAAPAPGTVSQFQGSWDAIGTGGGVPADQYANGWQATDSGVPVNRFQAANGFAVAGDHGSATDSISVALPVGIFDRGWATDSGKLATPMFAVPGDHGSVTDGSSAQAPVSDHPIRHGPARTQSVSPTNGGRGTLVAR